VALGVIATATAALTLFGGATAAAKQAKGPPPGTPHWGGWAHWAGPNGSYGNFGTKKPARSKNAAPAAPAAVDNLANPNDNEIMPTTNTHLIFWLPSGFHYSGGTTAADDTAYENAMIKYFQDVGGSEILDTATQYCGKGICPDDTSTYKDMVVDTTAFPHAGTNADPVTQSDLNTEVFNQLKAKSWPTGLSDMYFVFLPSNVVDCGSGGGCNTNAYCAYHTYGYVGSSSSDDTPANTFVWADIPDNRSPQSIAAGCGDSNVTGNESADTTLSSVEHEHLEAITDPRLNAWQDSTGGAGENGDKCNRNMGVANASKTTTNNYLGSGAADKFRIQREWSNAAGGGSCAASYSTTGSKVESPVPATGDVTLSVTESTIAGNTSDTLDYTLTFKNPSDQDDAYGVTVADTLPSGVQFNGSGTVTLGPVDLAPHESKTWTIAAHPSTNLLAGATLTDQAVFSFKDSTGADQPTITRTATTTVVNAAPVLGTLANQTVDYHDPLSFGVSATDSDAGDTLSFSASGLPTGLSLTDNGDRTATISGTDTAVPGTYTVTVSVDDHHHASATSGTLTIRVTKEETSLAYTGQVVILVGSSGATLSAKLQEDGPGDDDGDSLPAAPDAGRSVTLSLAGKSCTGSTDASGNASCTIPYSQLSLVALGPETINATFAGDTLYLSSSASASAIVFAFPSRGAFALGDQTVAAASSSTTVTWWADSWNQLNALTGGQAPSSLKGFAGSINSLPTGGAQPTSCTGTWKTSGGNSPPPTSGVPGYMGVLVTANVKKNGNTISGDFVHIVVVHVAPGYGPTPDHPGRGTIVATYC
jgi:fimbrial isopeptide formation D2 family protein